MNYSHLGSVFIMSVESKTEYVPGDPVLIRNIISQLKSQGVFDQFRKECISDVDTKPAYQNLCHTVDGQVSSYLSDIRWGPDLNKNQLRENIRKYVNECAFVEPGIARIVDQLVNPRINTVLVPKVEDVVYQYIGIPRVERNPSTELGGNQGTTTKTENQNSTEKPRFSNFSVKSNYGTEHNWSKSPSQGFEDSEQADKDVSDNLSFSEIHTVPLNEMKEKYGESGTEFKLSEGLEDDDSRAYSNIDSEEENLHDDGDDEVTPRLEISCKSDPEVSAISESQCSADTCGSKSVFEVELADDKTSVFASTEHESEDISILPRDDIHSSDMKECKEVPPAPLDVPKTPTIIYETSDDSDDNYAKLLNFPKNMAAEENSGPLVYDIPDFSSVDKIARKIAEENPDQEKLISTDEMSLGNDHCDSLKNSEVTNKSKEGKSDRHYKDGDKEGSAKLNESKHRERKHSEHRKEKHKSDKRDSSRDDKEHRSHRDKERSVYDSAKSRSSKSRNESRDKTRKSSDEKEKDDETLNASKIKDDGKSRKAQDERKIRDKDDRKHKAGTSCEKRSKDDKSTDKRSKSDDTKEDKKKKKLDNDRSKDKKSFQDDDKTKFKKSEGSETKKSSKSQCGSDEKKARTDRRSSDRDSNGPSSSANNSHHRSFSKSDKEKHSEKSRHSSSISSSHKSKKNDTAKHTSDDRHSKDGSQYQATSRSKENYQHKKINKVEKIHSNRTDNDHGDLEQMLNTIHGHEDADSKLKEESIKKSLCLSSTTPVKRSFEETDSEELVSVLNDTICGHESPLKICEKNQSEFGMKKPKIARNESEFGMVVKLRKEYKEKMKFLQQQGKENANFMSHSRVSDDEKCKLDRMSPVSTLKESVVVSKNCKNGTIKEMKLNIARIDNSYTIVNGTCFLNDANSQYNFSNHLTDAEKNVILTKTDSTQPNLQVKSTVTEKQDKMFKFKIRRSNSPTNGKERMKYKISPSSEGKELRSNMVSNVNILEELPYLSSENEDDYDDEDHLNDELINEMNIEEIIGCRADSARISYDSGLVNEKIRPAGDESIKDLSADHNTKSLMMNDKENVISKNQCFSNLGLNGVMKKSSPDIRYFEPSSPNNEFRKVVEETLEESHRFSFSNISIELNYPEEYDGIFQNQLGATVKRVTNVEKILGDQSIAQDIISPVDESYSSSDKKQLPFKDDVKKETKSSGEFFKSEENEFSTCYYDFSTISEEQKGPNAVVHKRKTLGIKRKISNVSGTSNSSIVSKDIVDSSQNILDVRDCKPSSLMTDDNLRRKSKSVSVSTPYTHVVESGICEQNLHSSQNSEFITTNVDPSDCEIKEDEKKSNNSCIKESMSEPFSRKLLKKSRRNSPVKCNYEQLPNEMVPKRTPYQNKCYYDSSDLYKPRPSFLASSRRSRALNSESK